MAPDFFRHLLGVAPSTFLGCFVFFMEYEPQKTDIKCNPSKIIVGRLLFEMVPFQETCSFSGRGEYVWNKRRIDKLMQYVVYVYTTKYIYY